MTDALSELRGLRQWICWKYEVVNGRETKIPYNPETNRKASTTDPATWTDYGTASAASGYDGVGFVVTKEDPYTGIDLDTCLGPDPPPDPHYAGRQELAVWATEIVRDLNSYTEVTPSGTGLRVWIKGKLPFGKHKAYMAPGGATADDHPPAVELYDQGRYFTITGKRLSDFPAEIMDRQEELDVLHARLFPSPSPSRCIAPSPSRSLALSDQAILTAIASAANGIEVMRLYDGHWEGGKYKSQSEADEGLCCHFAFYTRDRFQIDSLFRSSGLMREKWDKRYGTGETWGDRTIDAALAFVTEQYHPPTPKPPHPADDPRYWEQAPPMDRTPEEVAMSAPDEPDAAGILKERYGIIRIPRDVGGSADAPTNSDERRWRTFTFSQLAEMGLEEPEFPVDRLIREGINLFMGKTGDGKTWFSTDLAMAIAAGGRALGHRPVIQGDVLYLAFEESRGEMFQRLLQIREEEQLFPNLQIASSSDEDWPMESMAATLEAVEQWLTLHPHARFVVFDPLLGYMAQMSANHAVVQGDYNIIRSLRTVARRHPGVAFLVHDHRSKAAVGNGRDPQDTGVHSTGIIAAADNRLTLVKEEGNVFKLHVRGRMVPNQELRLHFDPGTGAWEVKEDARTLRQSEVGVAIVRELALAYPESLHHNVLAERLSATIGTVKGRLFRLQRTGHVIRTGNGYYRAPERQPHEPV